MACRQQKKADEAKAEIELKHPKCSGKLKVIQLDISDPENIDKFIEAIQSLLGKVDCLINNAGITIEPKDGINNENDARKISEVNYFGTRHLTRLNFPYLKNNGKVITVTSSAGKLNHISLFKRLKLLNEVDNCEVEIDMLAEEYF